MGQMMLLPTNLEELIPENHLVRVISRFVDRMDLSALEAKYKGGGTSSYHPKMMLKVYLYAYTQKTYSSRRIAKSLRENIHFMWLSGNNRPDHRTINYFRGRMLAGVIEPIFASLLKLLEEEGYIKLEEYFVDGTKMEANANRYTFVWAKNIQRYEKQLKEKVGKLFEEIEKLNQAEDAEYGERDLEEMGEGRSINSEKLVQRVQELNEQLKSIKQVDQEQPPKDEPPPGRGGQPELLPGQDQHPREDKGQADAQLSKVIANKLKELKQDLAEDPNNKILKKAVKQIEEDYLPRAQKYESQTALLAGRNSYSKTDPDATFMRMKDDHMRNGQLKPAYNIQTGTEGRFVVGFSVHQEVGDTSCLIPHLDKLKGWLGRLPNKVISDAGYGSEENYHYLESEQLGNYLKYASFHKEQKPRYRPDPFRAENMPYDPEQDQFTCPNGRVLNFLYTYHTKTKNGYLVEPRVYGCEDCQGCPLKEKCTRAAGNRRMKVNFQLWEYRRQARENLRSEEGQRLRKQRSIDVESVFGRIKVCWDFHRFLLRGMVKVTVEWGLLCLAHNLTKVWNALNGPKLVTE